MYELCINTKIVLSMKSILLQFFLIFSFFTTFSQHIDSTQSFFKGQITATNNGVSLIPSFSLGRPAILFDLNLGKGRLSFDPMLRFGMNGKPWAFVFWWRYKLIQQRKFNLGIGAHPSVVFRDLNANVNGIQKDLMVAQRYFAWEASPSYLLTKKTSIGLYYLGSKGLTKDIIQNTIFIAARASFNNLKVSNSLFFNVSPQVYYLKMDKNDGTYTNITLNLFSKKSPFSINAVVSKAIETKITGKDFLWSLGLVYNINNKYQKVK